MKLKPSILALVVSLILFTPAAPIPDSAVAAALSPYLDIDNFETAPKVAEIHLVNERIRTHHWQISLSDEDVLTCVGTKIRGQNTEFTFSGLSPGICDVTFEYKKRHDDSDVVLITEVYRFYVDPELGVTCEHIHFSTNET